MGHREWLPKRRLSTDEGLCILSSNIPPCHSRCKNQVSNIHTYRHHFESLPTRSQAETESSLLQPLTHPTCLDGMKLQPKSGIRPSRPLTEGSCIHYSTKVKNLPSAGTSSARWSRYKCLQTLSWPHMKTPQALNAAHNTQSSSRTIAQDGLTASQAKVDAARTASSQRHCTFPFMSEARAFASIWIRLIHVPVTGLISTHLFKSLNTNMYL